MIEYREGKVRINESCFFIIEAQETWEKYAERVLMIRLPAI